MSPSQRMPSRYSRRSPGFQVAARWCQRPTATGPPGGSKYTTCDPFHRANRFMSLITWKLNRVSRWPVRLAISVGSYLPVGGAVSWKINSIVVWGRSRWGQGPMVTKPPFSSSTAFPSAGPATNRTPGGPPLPGARPWVSVKSPSNGQYAASPGSARTMEAYFLTRGSCAAAGDASVNRSRAADSRIKTGWRSMVELLATKQGDSQRLMLRFSVSGSRGELRRRGSAVAHCCRPTRARQAARV